MTRGEVKERLKRYINKALQTGGMTTAELEELIQQGIDDVNRLLFLFPSSTTFNVVADVATYSILSNVPLFLQIDKGGIWWNDGSNWNRLDAYTEEGMNNDFPYWRDDSSSTPLRYFIEGDIITIHNTPDTALDDGFKIYHNKLTQRLTEDEQYLFSAATSAEYPNLEFLHDNVLDFCVWKLTKTLDKPQIGSATQRQVYYDGIKISKKQLKQNKDIGANTSVKLRNGYNLSSRMSGRLAR